MAWSLVQKASSNGTVASGGTLSFGSAPAQYDLLVALLKTTSAFSAVSDTLNGNWSQAFIAKNGSGLWVPCCYMVAGASQPEAVEQSGATAYMDIYEFSGNSRSLVGVLDQAATNNGTGSNNSADLASITTGASNGTELIIAACGLSGTSGTASPTVNQGLTVGEVNPASTSAELMDGYLLTGAESTTYDPEWTWTTSRTFACGVASFKPPSTKSSGLPLALIGRFGR